MRNIVCLAKCQPFTAEDGVSCHDMEIELRQRPITRVLLSVQIKVQTHGKFKREVPAGTSIHGRNFCAVQKGKRLVNSNLCLGYGSWLRVTVAAFLEQRIKVRWQRFVAKTVHALMCLEAGKANLGR